MTRSSGTTRREERGPDLLLAVGGRAQGRLQPLELSGGIRHVAGDVVGAVVEDGVEADDAQAGPGQLRVEASYGREELRETAAGPRRRRTHGTLRQRGQSFRLQPRLPQLSGSSVDGVGGTWHLVLEEQE